MVILYILFFLLGIFAPMFLVFSPHVPKGVQEKAKALFENSKAGEKEVSDFLKDFPLPPPKETYFWNFCDIDKDFTEENGYYTFNVVNISQILGMGWSLLCMYGGKYTLIATESIVEYLRINPSGDLCMVMYNQIEISQKTAKDIILHYGLDKPYFDDLMEKVYNIPTKQ